MNFDNYLVVEPAYGRGYDNLADARTDWYEGLDFRVFADGPYLSQRDEDLIRADGYRGVYLVGVGILEGYNG